jgi:hypothetical protein
MATYTYGSSPSPLQDTDANFRLWVTGVVTVLNNVLTDCADLGEINLATVAKPATTYAIQGYKMYRFSDSLQSTYPIYLKVGFGSYSTAATPLIQLQYGTGTDGSLGLTGIVSTPTSIGCYNGSAATGRMIGSYSMSAGSGGGRFWVALWDNASASGTYYGQYFGAERLRDASGVPITGASGGLCAFQQSCASDANNKTGGQFYWNGSVWTTFNGAGFGGMTPYASNGIRGSNNGVWPLFVHDGSLYRGPLYSAALVKTATITPGGTISFTHFGSARTFFCLGNPTTYYGGRIHVAGTQNIAAYYDSPVLIWE